MKKLLFLLVLLSQVTLAQELDSLGRDSVEVILPEHVLGAYVIGGISITPNPTPTGLGWVNTFGLGVRYDKMEAGFTISNFGTIYQERIVFPNIFDLKYRHGGGYFAYRVAETQYLGFSPFLSIQLGDMVWERSRSGNNFIRDEFILGQIGIKIDVPFLQKFEYVEYIRPEVTIGYQLMNDLTLAGVTDQDFSGFFIGFNVKLGYFNQ